MDSIIQALLQPLCVNNLPYERQTHSLHARRDSAKACMYKVAQSSLWPADKLGGNWLRLLCCETA